ncbi:ABC transporter [Bradyrhizobium sp. NAS80.1]|uniref:ABC transporter ATP-binding protein n=1 Tax=Bradyrhizobium sp. NAS80.1 TaxID=1680159 RepID=UPI000969AA32|nr:ABC transporter ATP-binding protein [Bradyrhizobium sp. NAS80.1]OKO86279.1 ABC transporter [Bradyrhizobium sp. NAS80.1]
MGNMLGLCHVSKSFGGLVAVDNVSFTIEEGEIVGLLGPNGSGKTTVLNMISGSFRPTSGEIWYKATNISRMRAHDIVQVGIARTFQLVRVLGAFTCAQNVAAALAFHPGGAFGRAAVERIERLLDTVGLVLKADALASDLTYIDLKRLELARALALDPSVLLLDEWLAGLSGTELDDGIALIRSLRTQGLTILLVEHVMRAIRALCDRCIVLSSAVKIAEGATGDVLSDPRVVTSYLGSHDA